MFSSIVVINFLIFVLTDNLYWIDTFAGTIEVCRSDGSQRMILKHTDNKLQSIALHPTKG